MHARQHHIENIFPLRNPNLVAGKKLGASRCLVSGHLAQDIGHPANHQLLSISPASMMKAMQTGSNLVSGNISKMMLVPAGVSYMAGRHDEV